MEAQYLLNAAYNSPSAVFQLDRRFTEVYQLWHMFPKAHVFWKLRRELEIDASRRILGQLSIKMPPTFCPYCCNCLTIAQTAPTAEHPQGVNAFTCRTCPYQFELDQPYYERTYMKQKQKADIMGEDQSDLPVNEVPGGCPNEKCDSKKAYYYQLQTRSADEPPTSFYKCIECSKQWREY